MSRFAIAASILLCIFFATSAQPQQRPAIPLPVDPSIVVLSLDFRGGLAGCVAPASRGPVLLIYADGKMITRKDICGPIFESHISLDVVQDLLRYIIDDMKLMTFTTDSAWEEIRSERSKRNQRVVASVSDSGEVVVHIHTATMEHEAAFEGLSFYLAENPGAHSLVQLNAVANRIDQLAKETNSHFLATFDSSILQANEYLRQNFPDLPGVSGRNRTRTISADGNRWVNEFRYNLIDGGSVLVTVATTGIENPEVTVTATPK